MLTERLYQEIARSRERVHRIPVDLARNGASRSRCKAAGRMALSPGECSSAYW
jgi:hypothetical protein